MSFPYCERVSEPHKTSKVKVLFFMFC
jgi:hypothetical protein